MKHKLLVNNYTYMVVEKVREGKETVDKDVEHDVDVRQELYEILRMPGVYSDGVETCDGVALAGDIKNCESDELLIDDNQIGILKRILNKLIKKEHNPMMRSYSLGGERYIPLIQRVFKAETIE